MKRMLYFFILTVILLNCVFVLAENTDKAPDFMILSLMENIMLRWEKRKCYNLFDGLNWSLGSVGSDKTCMG